MLRFYFPGIYQVSRHALIIHKKKKILFMQITDLTFIFFQILFWIYSTFVILASCLVYPISLRMKPSYPANNLRGRICMGQGITFESLTNVSSTVNGIVIALAGILLFWMFFFNKITEKFLKKKSSRNFNSDHR